MLESLLGSRTREQVLMYILARDEAYATEIARFYEISPNGVQKQLDRLEEGGVFVSWRAGRTRLYSFNPRFPFLKDLRALLEKALTFYSDSEREALLVYRRRPRRRGKPL